MKICLIILQMKRGITKTNYRTIDKGYADCMLHIELGFKLENMQ